MAIFSIKYCLDFDNVKREECYKYQKQTAWIQSGESKKKLKGSDSKERWRGMKWAENEKSETAVPADQA